MHVSSAPAPALLRALIPPRRSAARGVLFALAFLRGFLRRLHRWAGVAGFANQFADGQVQLAPRRIDAGDDDFGDIADADFLARALAADDARAFVDVPPIVHQVFVADQ